MNIALSAECPIFKPPNEAHLHKLLYAVAVRRWHTIVAPARSRLKSSLPPHIWNIYGEQLQRSHKAAANSANEWVAHADCESCDAEKIAHFYNLPSILIVENAHTDGNWAHLVASLLRPRVARQLKGAGGAVSIVQAGGVGEIPKELHRLAPQYLSCRPKGMIPLRVMAVADSDSKAPGTPSSQAREILDAAAQTGATAHILAKRTIENYIPDNSLRQYADTRRHCMEAVTYVTSLTGPSRDHYPLKSGLSESDIQAFHGYPPNAPLGLGLGDFMPDLLENFFHAVTAHELRARDGASELDDLLDKLERNL